MSFAEYKERISEGDTVILFLVSISHFNSNIPLIAKCDVLFYRVLDFFNTCDTVIFAKNYALILSIVVGF